jgi:hypothetical protein
MRPINGLHRWRTEKACSRSRGQMRRGCRWIMDRRFNDSSKGDNHGPCEAYAALSHIDRRPKSAPRGGAAEWRERAGAAGLRRQRCACRDAQGCPSHRLGRALPNMPDIVPPNVRQDAYVPLTADQAGPAIDPAIPAGSSSIRRSTRVSRSGGRAARTPGRQASCSGSTRWRSR